MRLLSQQLDAIRLIAHELAGADARIWLFGSRLDDAARGGDVDLLVDSERSVDHPALLAASLSARISLCLQGRKVDVLIAAPNLAVLPILTVAREEGQAL